MINQNRTKGIDSPSIFITSMVQQGSNKKGFSLINTLKLTFVKSLAITQTQTLLLNDMFKRDIFFSDTL